MKKIFALILVVCMVAALTACGESKQQPATTPAETTTEEITEAATSAPETTQVETTAAEPAPAEETSAEEADTTEADTEQEPASEEAGPITEGTIDLVAATVELADGWYSKKAPTDTEVELVNDAVKGFLASVKVKCTKVISGEGAEHWVGAIQNNMQGKGEISNVTYNGVDYFMLSNCTDSGNQTYLFADSSDGEYWVQVSIYMMDFASGEPMLDHISIK